MPWSLRYFLAPSNKLPFRTRHSSNSNSPSWHRTFSLSEVNISKYFLLKLVLVRVGSVNHDADISFAHTLHLAQASAQSQPCMHSRRPTIHTMFQHPSPSSGTLLHRRAACHPFCITAAQPVDRIYIMQSATLPSRGRFPHVSVNHNASFLFLFRPFVYTCYLFYSRIFSSPCPICFSVCFPTPGISNQSNLHGIDNPLNTPPPRNRRLDIRPPSPWHLRPPAVMPDNAVPLRLDCIPS